MIKASQLNAIALVWQERRADKCHIRHVEQCSLMEGLGGGVGKRGSGVTEPDIPKPRARGFRSGGVTSLLRNEAHVPVLPLLQNDAGGIR